MISETQLFQSPQQYQFEQFSFDRLKNPTLQSLVQDSKKFLQQHNLLQWCMFRLHAKLNLCAYSSVHIVSPSTKNVCSLPIIKPKQRRA